MDVKTCLNSEQQSLIEQIGFDKRIVRAEGHYVYDEHGKAYLDLATQVGCVPFGHHPAFVQESINLLQSHKQPAVNQSSVASVTEALAEVLLDSALGKIRHVIFTNTGSETIETALKLAQKTTQRSVVLGTTSASSRKTLGTNFTVGEAIDENSCLTNPQGLEYVPYGDLDALQTRLMEGDIAAFIVKPIWKEDEIISPPLGYLPTAAQLCSQAGTLFILDETQIELGRTGYLFASEHEQVEADIVLLLQPLEGDLVSLGACLCSDRICADAIEGLQGSMIVDEQKSCSVLAMLRYLQQDNQALVKQVRDSGEYLQQGLTKLVARYPKAFRSVSGRGFMQGLQLAFWDYEQSYFMSYAGSTGRFLQFVCGYLLYEHCIFTIPKLNSTTTLPIEPPLTIGTSELDHLLKALDELGQMLEQGNFSKLLSYVVGTIPQVPSISASARQPLKNATVRSYAVPTAEKCLGRFTFFAHPAQFDDLVSFMPPALQAVDSQQKQKLAKWLTSWCAQGVDPGVVYHVPRIHSQAGGYVEGWLICNLLMPRQLMRLTQDERREVINRFVDISRDLNADVIGLGGFSAVITNAGADLIDCGLHVTSGNSLTAMASAESLKVAARSLGINLEKSKVGIVGAAGSVGYLVCKNLVFSCKELVLFGNPANPKALRNLEAIAGELYWDLIQAAQQHNHHAGVTKLLFDLVGGMRGIPMSLLTSQTEDDFIQLYEWVEAQARLSGAESGPVKVTVDLKNQLPCMEAVVSATSQGYSFIEPSLLAPNAIVCDSARPPDVMSSVKRRRKDVLVYEGGLIQFPEPVKFGASNQANQPIGLGFACLVETIVLAMSGLNRNFSIGRRIPYTEALEVFDLAKKHGFEINQPVPKDVSVS